MDSLPFDYSKSDRRFVSQLNLKRVLSTINSTLGAVVTVVFWITLLVALWTTGLRVAVYVIVGAAVLILVFMLFLIRRAARR